MGQWVGSGHITKYQINLDLIKIIQFCLNIYDLLDIFLDILLKPPQSLTGLFLPSTYVVGNYFSRVCLSICLSIQVITFEPLKVGTSFLVYTYIFIISRSSLSTKVIGSRSRSND